MKLLELLLCADQRKEKFVTEEWVTYFADGAVRQAKDVEGGWKGMSTCKPVPLLMRLIN